MFGTNWQTSPREFDVIVERDVAIPVDDDVDLVGDVFRPDSNEAFPVILSASPYNVEYQAARITPRRSTSGNAWIESGDPYFYARRGYAFVVINVRGTGKSGGRFRNLGPREVTDIVEAIAWLADQPWSDGSVAMTGISYFGMIQPFVAERNPDALKTIFAPWAATDLYRDWYYHGGISHYYMTYKWSQQLDNLRPYRWSRNNLNEEEFDRRIETALNDEEIRAHPVLVEALENPDKGFHPYVVDTTINRLDEPGGYWDERRLSYEYTEIPGYFGADWHHTHIHLTAGFRNFTHWDGPAKLMVGPPEFADRPFYQLQYESLRWFDHWLKGNDTGFLDEPSVKLFNMGNGTWKKGETWPLPETKWTPFYLHPDGVLSEGDHYPKDGYTTFEDSPFGRGALTFYSPKLVEQTEIIGPIRADLYASTTAEEVLFFVSFMKQDPDGTATEVAPGWLRGSQRTENPNHSAPWVIARPHDEREPVPPNEVVQYRLNLNATAMTFAPGERFGLRIRCADVDDASEIDIAHEGIQSAYTGGRHVARQSPSRVTVYHNEEYPSNLLLPITAGNVMGTFRSGGEPVAFDERMPYEKVWMDERESTSNDE